MALLPIIVAPDPRLKINTEPVVVVDDELRRFLEDMQETMYAADGIGLAAPQVGDRRSIIVLDVSNREEGRQPLCLINPEIVWNSDEQRTHQEGCLSLPEHFAEVKRPISIRLNYLDKYGTSQELKADGMLATCIQHEMDHLNGVFIVDRVGEVERIQYQSELKALEKNSKKLMKSRSGKKGFVL